MANSDSDLENEIEITLPDIGKRKFKTGTGIICPEPLPTYQAAAVW